MKLSKSFLFLFVVCQIFASCKKEQTTESLAPTTPEPDFKNQVMQGKIGSEAWVSVSGKAEVDFFDSTSYRLNFYTDTSSCSFTPFSENRVFGSIPRQLGKYTLNNSGNAFLTLYHGQSQLNFARTGLIEITKIDTSAHIIEGRVSLPGTADYNMNGNFSAKICD